MNNNLSRKNFGSGNAFIEKKHLALLVMVAFSFSPIVYGKTTSVLNKAISANLKKNKVVLSFKTQKKKN
jgi:hypothetical protein